MSLGTSDCPTGKQKYTSKKTAKELAKKFTQRFGRRQRPYECPYCGLWHLTTQKPDEYERRQQEKKNENH